MKNELKREETLFLFIDVQDSLLKAMAEPQEVENNTKALAQAVEIMGLESIFTTQYKKGLGEFNKEARAMVTQGHDFDKKTFSCMLDENISKKIREIHPKSVVVSGIEAHICVLLTVRDLINEGYDVYVAGDAISSRRQDHKEYAIGEMRDLGAVVRATESILFDLNSISGTEEFKAIQKLIK